MDKEEMEAALARALDRFVNDDAYLLAVDSSERSMSHRIAVHLAIELGDYDIDCEYNRDGFDVKRLNLGERWGADDEDEAVTVFPNIIVHRRGTNDQNLLAIEIKKASALGGFEYDCAKLTAFRADLNYKWAIHVIIGNDRHGVFRRVITWIE